MSFNEIPEKEVEKWLNKLKEKLPKIKPMNEKGKEFLENIKAYVFDAEHFYKKGNLFLSFEACIWAWAFYVIGKDLKLVE